VTGYECPRKKAEASSSAAAQAEPAEPTDPYVRQRLGLPIRE
jgi:hypothetical protein